MNILGLSLASKNACVSTVFHWVNFLQCSSMFKSVLLGGASFFVHGSQQVSLFGEDTMGAVRFAVNVLLTVL